MSLFGKLVPLNQPVTQITPEVTTILGKVLEDAGLKSPARKLCCEQLRELHDRLDVLMFNEILTYLPAKHLDAFVKMNDEKRSREEIDKFLEENMRQMQRKSLKEPLPNSGSVQCRGTQRPARRRRPGPSVIDNARRSKRQYQQPTL